MLNTYPCAAFLKKSTDLIHWFTICPPATTPGHREQDGKSGEKEKKSHRAFRLESRLFEGMRNQRGGVDEFK